MLKSIIVNLRHALHNNTRYDVAGSDLYATEVQDALDDAGYVSDALSMAEATIERLASTSAKLASVQGTLSVLGIARARLRTGSEG